MNELMIFNSPEFGKIRTLEEDGQVLFCGKDVAKALGYSNPRDALSRHCKGVVKRDTPTENGNQEMSFIPESDVYRLITHSKLPTAQRFEAWVFEEVLPALRAEGCYTVAKSKPSTLEAMKLQYICQLRKIRKSRENTLKKHQYMTKHYRTMARVSKQTESEICGQLALIDEKIDFVLQVTPEIWDKLSETMDAMIEETSMLLEGEAFQESKEPPVRR